jgi:hypothetical protein
MIWASVITGVFALAAAVMGTLNHKRIGEVHVMVNSRLDTALAQIEDLKTQRDLKHDEDHATGG